MTDQGIAFLALHFVIDACIVTARWTHERLNGNKPCKYLIDSISDKYENFVPQTYDEKLLFKVLFKKSEKTSFLPLLL